MLISEALDAFRKMNKNLNKTQSCNFQTLRYTVANGPEIQEASFWMTALARSELDERERREAEAKEAGPSVTIVREPVSAFAQEWLDNKRKREAEKEARKRKADVGSCATLPLPLDELRAADAAAAAARAEKHLPVGTNGEADGDGVSGDVDDDDGEGEGDEEEDDDTEERDPVKLWQEGWKERYYLFKFQTSTADKAFVTGLTREYVRGLCFVLQYYFQVLHLNLQLIIVFVLLCACWLATCMGCVGMQCCRVFKCSFNYSLVVVYICSMTFFSLKGTRT